ncbi:hypothetical protein [Microbispora sp. NPDC049633]|uniref:hypothetical protein n=1 Tax=Microbispora sp. NPDC049633 TaxID=3154355 RepID=UPI003420B709
MTSTNEETAPAAAPVELDHVGRLLRLAYRQLGKQIDDLTEQRDRIREQLEARIGDAPGATVDGEPAISFTWSKPAMAIDSKALAKDHPQIYAQYLKPKKASRPFKLVGED